MTPSFDNLIQGGLVVTGEGMRRADVGIRGETVEAVSADLSPEGARRVADASGKLLLPGIVDVHTHPVYLDDIHHTSVSAAPALMTSR